MKIPIKATSDKIGFSIKMTPMIDVIFLLMIFFIMTLNIQDPEGFLKNRLPDQTAPTVSDRQTDWEVVRIHLAVRKGQPHIFLQKRLINDLPDLLRNLNLLPRDIMIVIEPESKIAYKHVIGVYDTCLKSQKTNIVFSVPPPSV